MNSLCFQRQLLTVTDAPRTLLLGQEIYLLRSDSDLMLLGRQVSKLISQLTYLTDILIRTKDDHNLHH